MTNKGVTPGTTAHGDGTPTFVGPVEMIGTCDWGACDQPADTLRWSKTHGWLGVCTPCSRPQGAKRGNDRTRPIGPGRADCPTCGGRYALRRDGTLRRHRWRPPGGPRGGVATCPGALKTTHHPSQGGSTP